MSSAVRACSTWRLRGRSFELGKRTLIMGVLNVTPDSFSDGGRWLEGKTALARSLEMLDGGADIVDLGGESTRPGAVGVSPAEEQRRVMPVLRAILQARQDAVLSIDTFHAETARMAVEAGAEIVNDVSGHLWDAEMAGTCAELRCGDVLMHTRGRPQEWGGLPPLAEDKVMPLVLRELEARAGEAMAAGVAREAIVLDPGFGFGKAHAGDWKMLGRFAEFAGLGFPLLAGVSRKGFLRVGLTAAGLDVEGLRSAPERWTEALDRATHAAGVAAVLAGAHILRVHDVAGARVAAATADRVLAGE